MSLDGFIATPDHGLEWLDVVKPPEGSLQDYGYAEFMKGIDTVILGRNTYDKVIGFQVALFRQKNPRPLEPTDPTQTRGKTLPRAVKRSSRRARSPRLKGPLPRRRAGRAAGTGLRCRHPNGRIDDPSAPGLGNSALRQPQPTALLQIGGRAQVRHGTRAAELLPSDRLNGLSARIRRRHLKGQAHGVAHQSCGHGHPQGTPPASP